MTPGQGVPDAAREPIIRFAKVSAIDGNNVHLTGLNLPTAKHVTFVLEAVPEPHLSNLRAALSSRVFLKVTIPGPALHFDIAEEGPASSRTESYFSLISYAGVAGYHPEFLRELDEYLITMSSYGSPLTDLGIMLLDVIDKLGSVFYARDQLTALSREPRPSHISGRIHIVNAIVACKGCLDGLAMMLNEVYGLGYSRGDIDLSKGRFIRSLGSANQSLGSRLSEHSSWIAGITCYRDEVIHRVMLLTPVSSVREIGGPESLSVQVPSVPVTIGSSMPRDVRWTPAHVYCQELIQRLTGLIEIICSDLLDLLRSRSYFAT